MLKFIKVFEQAIIVCLVGLMAVVVLLSTLELGWILLQDILRPPLFMFEVEELLGLFGFFLLILIGIELMESTRAYLKERIMRSEIVLTVAIIALSRKVIILEAQEYQGDTLIGIGIIILGLSVSYYLLKRVRLLGQTSEESINRDF